jgi:hypothetical protein
MALTPQRLCSDFARLQDRQALLQGRGRPHSAPLEMDARDRVGSSARPSNDRVGLLYTAHKCAYPNAWSVQLTLNTHVSLPTCFLDPSSLAKASLNMPPYAAPASNGYRPNRWIVAWFVVSTLLVAWDTGYMLLRCALSTPRLPRSHRPRLLTRDAARTHSPRTFPGGDLFWFWKPYVLYAKTDLVYSRAAYESKDGFAAAQCELLSLASSGRTTDG